MLFYVLSVVFVLELSLSPMCEISCRVILMSVVVIVNARSRLTLSLLCLGFVWPMFCLHLQMWFGCLTRVNQSKFDVLQISIAHVTCISNSKCPKFQK